MAGLHFINKESCLSVVKSSNGLKVYNYYNNVVLTEELSMLSYLKFSFLLFLSTPNILIFFLELYPNLRLDLYDGLFPIIDI